MKETPLQLAVENEKGSIVKYLIEHGKIDISQFDQVCWLLFLHCIYWIAVTYKVIYSKTSFKFSQTMIGQYWLDQKSFHINSKCLQQVDAEL